MTAPATKDKIGLVISTYDRVEDARIQMEIVRDRWSSHFDVYIVHCVNGDPAWYPDPHLEDALIRLSNRGHFQGAVDLMEAGLARLERITWLDYAVHASADTWLVRPESLVEIVGEMRARRQPLASSAWGTRIDANPWRVGLAMDFCVLDLRWAKAHRFLPIAYDDFCARHGEVISYGGDLVYPERVVALRFLQAVKRAEPQRLDGDRWRAGDERLYRIADREPVHDLGRRRMSFPDLGLWTHHDRAEKAAMLIEHGLDNVGPYARRLAAEYQKGSGHA